MELFRSSLQEHSLLSELVVKEKMTRENNEPMDGENFNFCCHYFALRLQYTGLGRTHLLTFVVGIWSRFGCSWWLMCVIHFSKIWYSV